MNKTIMSAAAIAALLAGQAVSSETIKNPLAGSSETWEYLHTDLFEDQTVTETSDILAMDAPYRAHDAATVPLVLKQADDSPMIKRATVIVDENPAPIVAEFEFSDAMAPLDFELRVRVDQYSNVRVISETDDGLYMTGRFVKASGGCAAPASRDPAVALAGMGEMKLRHFEPAAAMSVPRREAQIMIRHPNYSGLQRDQITQLFIQAHFIDRLEVWQGEEMLFSTHAGISISENPTFRFAYNDNGSPSLTVKATDTEGNVFEQVLPKDGSST